MSFRSTTAKAMPANQDRSRGPHTSRRTQDGDAGSTAPPRRFGMSAAGSASSASNMGSRLTAADGVADVTDMPMSIFSNSRRQQSVPLNAVAQSGASSSGPSTPDSPQHTAASGAPRSFLQTRRRHPSTNNAKLPLGPRPIDSQNTGNR